MSKEQFLKAMVKVLKEAGRWALVAAIPVVLAYLDALSAEWAIALAGVLRLLDKIIHEIGKEIENEELVKGLVRF